ncbi:hypothetical protein DMH25_20645 [Streptomyces sp. WAC 01325]|nr:hypothetical protein DMH25_20645 [Streptomyces sp. WAC 01325]
MALRKLGKDPESPSGGSPTIYLDEERDSYLVQGWKVEIPSSDRADRRRLPTIQRPPRGTECAHGKSQP